MTGRTQVDREQKAPPAQERRAPARLRYLRGFGPGELAEFKASYGKSPEELDQVVAEHPWLYRFFYANYFVANYGSCGLYLIFPFTNTASGINSTAQEIEPGTQLPSAVSYGIGGPIAVSADLYYMFLFSVRKEAVKSTLYFASFTPLRQSRDRLLQHIRENKRQVAIDVLKFIAHQSVLLPVNLTGTITELIYLPMDFSRPGEQAGTAVTLFYGNLYYMKYTNPDYYTGLEFWENLKNRPWLFWDDILHGRIATPLQVWLQGLLSTIGLRIYPLYYYIALTAQKTVGIWFSPYYVVAATFLHSMCVRYPSTYDHYLTNREALHAILDAKPEIRREAEDNLRMMGLPVTEDSLREMRREIIWLMHRVYRNKMTKGWGPFFLWKHSPITAVQVLFRTFLGAYFGYGVSGPLTPSLGPTAALAVSVSLPALTAGNLLYDAEVERIAHEEQLKNMPPPAPQPEDKKADIQLTVRDLPVMAIPDGDPRVEAERSSVALGIAVFLNVSGAVVGAMSTVYTLQALIGDSSPETTTSVTLLAIEQMLNSIHFAHKKLCDSVGDLYSSLPSCRSFCPRLFQPRRLAPVPAVPQGVPQPPPQARPFPA